MEFASRPPTDAPLQADANPTSWMDPWDSPMPLPALKMPYVDPPDANPIPSSANVVGVSVGNEHRAYLIQGMQFWSCRVINDMVDGKPITIIYSRRPDRVRVLTGDSHEPLPIGLFGWKNGEQVMTFGKDDEGRFGFSEKAPFDDYEFERTSWAAWKRKHPKTLVYTGIEDGPSLN